MTTATTKKSKILSEVLSADRLPSVLMGDSYEVALNNIKNDRWTSSGTQVLLTCSTQAYIVSWIKGYRKENIATQEANTNTAEEMCKLIDDLL